MVERVPVVLGGGIGDRDGEGGQQCALFPLHPGGPKKKAPMYTSLKQMCVQKYPVPS
jgi:hypothetical protein